MPRIQPLLIVNVQRHRGDCSVASLATLLRIPYEEVLAVAARQVATVLVDGLNNDEIIKVAEKFGKTLTEKQSEEIDYRSGVGILGGHLSGNPVSDEHAVVLSHGLVFDPETGEIWRARDWIRRFKVTNLDLLELED